MESSVAKEVLAGDGIYPAQAARLIPRHRLNRPVSPITIVRWMKAGVRLADGERLRLEAVRLAGRWLTSRAALIRFLERQTPVRDAPSAVSPRTPRQRDHAHNRADAVLERRYGM